MRKEKKRRTGTQEGNKAKGRNPARHVNYSRRGHHLAFELCCERRAVKRTRRERAANESVDLSRVSSSPFVDPANYFRRPLPLDGDASVRRTFSMSADK